MAMLPLKQLCNVYRFTNLHYTDIKPPCYCFLNIFLGTDGIIIVDATESGETALKVFREFRKITDKPLKGIVITHFHTGWFLKFNYKTYNCSAIVLASMTKMN